MRETDGKRRISLPADHHLIVHAPVISPEDTVAERGLQIPRHQHTPLLQQGGVLVTGNLQAAFSNCIFWGDNGSVDNEVVVSRQGNSPFAVGFSHCLWRVKTAPAGVTTT